MRVTVPALGFNGAVGMVREATKDSLRVAFDNPRRTVAMERTAITEMDVSVERHKNTLKGLGLGLAIGGGGGALIGLASGDDPPGLLSFSAGEKAAILGGLLGVSGAVIGLIAGSHSRSDTWAPVEPTASASPDVSIVPFTTERGTGLHLGLSIPVR